MAAQGSIFDLKRFAIHDGPGIRTTVFMRGCPLNCWWCHNPESRPLYANEPSAAATACVRRRNRTALADGPVSAKAVIDEVARDVPYYDQSGGGVTFSGGEPLLQPGFLLEMLQLSRLRSIHTAVDTTGLASSEKLERIADFVDLFLYDLKIMDDLAHQENIGVSNRLILDNLRMLAARRARVIIRVPLIPGVTDSEANLEAIVAFVKPLSEMREISLLPYHHYFRHKISDPAQQERLAALKPKSPTEVTDISRRLEAHGFRVKIGG